MIRATPRSTRTDTRFPYTSRFRSVPDALVPPSAIRAYAVVAPLPEIKMTPSRRRVLAVLESGPPRPARELAREAGVGVSVVKILAEAGALASVDLPPPPGFTPPATDAPGPPPSAAQANPPPPPPA